MKMYMKIEVYYIHSAAEYEIYNPEQERSLHTFQTTHIRVHLGLRTSEVYKLIINLILNCRILGQSQRCTKGMPPKIKFLTWVSLSYLFCPSPLRGILLSLYCDHVVADANTPENLLIE